ncbi:helix-turn-helix domain-containing protein [Aneurinibacillus tyrosinisolvens]|uniref:helix-turn-helix domain-containing protein n=1 Tax=Aneurinibacillus tyrosinisolvens TaxID=1443435 RepID=UPI00069B37B8|nr:helix-turn-helix transcriptional regulator [Aneurinibacillus tyrosinisolvens]
MKKRSNDRAVNDNFGSTMKYYRERKNMSLQQLFEKTGVSSGYLCRLENGQRKAPSVPIASKIATALEIPLSLLLDISTNETPIDEAPSIAELILYNDCKIDEENLIGKEAKEILVQIIEFIIEASWDKENKIKQLFDLSELIDDFKEVS